jgi:hypothetical protein
MYISTFFLPRHYMEISGQLHTTASLRPEERAPGNHWRGGWVEPRAGQDDVKKILDPTGTRTPTLRSSSSYSSIFEPNLTFEWLALLLRICEVPC